MYTNGAQQSASGAVFPDAPSSIPNIGAEFLGFTSKSVEVWPNLPPRTWHGGNLAEYSTESAPMIEFFAEGSLKNTWSASTCACLQVSYAVSDGNSWHGVSCRRKGRGLMSAGGIRGIDLVKIAGESISGWVPSFKTGESRPTRQPFCSLREERLLLYLEYHPLVAW
jgi:hypothetical protein